MVDCVAIVSGGMDSVTLLHYLTTQMQRRPAVITFDYGQKHAKEIDFARWQVAELGIENHFVLDIKTMLPLFGRSALTSAETPIPNSLDVLGDPQPPTYVPNRNMIFLALAVAYAETQQAKEVFYGAQLHDLYGYWDTTPTFLTRLNEVYSLNRRLAVQIRAPFVEKSKTEIVRLGLQLGVDFAHTWSCYEGREKACGICPTCNERLNAFEAMGMIDPVPYDEVE